MHQQLQKNRSKVAPPSQLMSFSAALATLLARLWPQQQSVPKGQSLLTKPQIDPSLSQAEGGFIPPQPLGILQSRAAAVQLAQTTCGRPEHPAWSNGAGAHPADWYGVSTAHCAPGAEHPWQDHLQWDHPQQESPSAGITHSRITHGRDHPQQRSPTAGSPMAGVTLSRDHPHTLSSGPSTAIRPPGGSPSTGSSSGLASGAAQQAQPLPQPQHPWGLSCTSVPMIASPHPHPRACMPTPSPPCCAHLG